MSCIQLKISRQAKNQQIMIYNKKENQSKEIDL